MWQSFVQFGMPARRRNSREWKVQLSLKPSRRTFVDGCSRVSSEDCSYQESMSVTARFSLHSSPKFFNVWLLRLGFFLASTQKCSPFLSLPIISRTTVMNTCNWNGKMFIRLILPQMCSARKTSQKSFVLTYHNWLFTSNFTSLHTRRILFGKCFCK